MQLRSVMDIPTESSLPVNIHHSSVRDYVSNPSNCSLPEVQPIASPHALLAYSSLRLMMQDIPSTALQNALAKLKKQSRATQSHDSDPQTLTRSLSFIVQSPEPLQVLKGLLWLQGDRSFYLQSWLETLDGHEWLHTRDVHDWLRARSRRDWSQTIQGLRQTLNEGLLRTAMQREQPWWNSQVQEWLKTQRGRDWLQNYGGQYWMETRNGRDWLETKNGGDWLRSRGGQNWLETEHSRDWMQTETGKDWIQSESGQDWMQSESGNNWLQSESGEDWLQSESGEDWLQSENGENWLQSESGQDWLQSERGEFWPQNESGRDWLQTRSGQYWLQTTRERDWLQTRGGQCWLQTPHGRAWRSTPSASVWVTMEEFSSTLEAINKYTIVPELSSLPTFQVIQQFKSLPDFLMFPVFLALRHQNHSNSASPHHRYPKIIRAMEAFVHFAKGAQKHSRSTSDALQYACQNWPIHLSRV